MTNTINIPKKNQYQSLVKQFKIHRFHDNKLLNPYSIEDAIFKHEVINPWNLWYGNLDADILLIGQDFSDVEYFKQNLFNNWEKERDNPTNKSLIELFSILGYKLDSFNPDATSDLPLYFTNAILGLKSGGIGASVKHSWHQETDREYLASLINIIQPKYIITMGSIAYKAICYIYDLHPMKTLNKAIENSPIELPMNSLVYVVAHCSSKGRINRNFEVQKKDWNNIKTQINTNA